MKKILFICDPLTTFKLATDTTYILMIAASKLGYHVHYCTPNNVSAINNQVVANTTELTIKATIDDNTNNMASPWYVEEKQFNSEPLTNYFAVLVRNDPPFNMEYYYLTQLMTIAEALGVNVVNNSYALRNFNEKLSILNFPEFITPTLVSRDKQMINDFINTHHDCVIKPLDLMAGRGVFKISPSEVNLGAILEASTNYYTQTVMVQKFIPEVVLGDRRIFIINGQVVSYCLHRIPQQNQIRGNIAAGGRGESHKIEPKDMIIATKIAKWLDLHKIKFAGIDIIGDYLTEINITSPTGIRLIYSQTGLDLSIQIIKSL